MVGQASCFFPATMPSSPIESGGSQRILTSAHGWDRRAAGSWLSDFRRTREWGRTSTCTGFRALEDTMGNTLAAELDESGIVVLRDLVNKQQLTSMQKA